MKLAFYFALFSGKLRS